MDKMTNGYVADIAAIKKVVHQELSLSWDRNKSPDWGTFTGSFLSSAALFPAARPVAMRNLGEFIDRMKHLRANGHLATFNVTPLGCEVLVFGNVAVAFAACQLLENETSINREVNATILVRENEMWRIAAQAWDVETSGREIPEYLVERR